LKVVDASAICAVLFGEPEGRLVIDQLGGEPLAAPSLLTYEVANTCRQKLRRHPEQRARLLAAHARFERLGLEQAPVDPAAVLQLAETTGLTAYDAAYVWLAGALGVELVSLDARVQRAATAQRQG